MKDPLYFPRTELASALLASLKASITHAFTLFAPRRMGKTEFLINDIAPLAEKDGFNVFYFSFMDGNSANNADESFHQALHQFAQEIRTGNGVKTLFSSFTKIDLLGVGLERTLSDKTLPNISEIIAYIATDNRPSLLLLDEVQELARIPNTSYLIRSLRTGLDLNKNRVKTIFTGSSTNGLRMMFNDVKAPFFHFAHALDFPNLDQHFTDFLADVYQERMSKSLDKHALYAVFERLNYTPMYMRAIIQDMIINPALSLEKATQIRLEQMQENGNFTAQWRELTAIEQFTLLAIAKGQSAVYGADFREQMAEILGVEEIKVSTMQSTIRKLQRKDLISKTSHGVLHINSPLLHTWLTENVESTHLA
ncbi:ATP-binding protein [Lonepinella sp. BR2882]|uniref:ATP-binding protein n=1 Tax=Lonepinella sp. BR2882 TaxID=3095283 RepID=UPI003F6E367A